MGLSIQNGTVVPVASTTPVVAVVGPPGPQGAAGSATDATTTSKGSIQLAGDLGGTASAPTVPGLAGKLPQTSVPGMVYLNDGSGVPSSTVTWATGNGAFTVPLRDANGRAQFTDPAAALDASNKEYTDAADAATLTTATGRAIAYAIALGG